MPGGGVPPEGGADGVTEGAATCDPVGSVVDLWTTVFRSSDLVLWNSFSAIIAVVRRALERDLRKPLPLVSFHFSRA